MKTPPAASAPDDDAARAAQKFLNEWGMFNFSADMCLAALLRARDAQAREAGRVEGWGQCVDAVMGCCGGRSHQKLRQRIRALKRPDRAKGGGER